MDVSLSNATAQFKIHFHFSTCNLDQHQLTNKENKLMLL